MTYGDGAAGDLLGTVWLLRTVVVPSLMWRTPALTNWKGFWLAVLVHQPHPCLDLAVERTFVSATPFRRNIARDFPPELV